jgi:hypothetical protein
MEAARIVIAAAAFDKNGHDLAYSRPSSHCCDLIVAYSGKVLAFGHEINWHVVQSRPVFEVQ